MTSGRVPDQDHAALIARALGVTLLVHYQLYGAPSQFNVSCEPLPQVHLFFHYRTDESGTHWPGHWDVLCERAPAGPAATEPGPADAAEPGPADAAEPSPADAAELAPTGGTKSEEKTNQ